MHYRPCRTALLWIKQSSRSKSSARIALQGYGLSLVMIFVLSTVLIGTSVQLMLGSTAGAYLGSLSQNNLSAKKVAESGLVTVLADIQSKLNSNLTVTTTYTYPLTNISIPNDPASLGGSTSVLGSFSGAVLAAQGGSYLVEVTGTVNGAIAKVSKLVTMSRNNGFTLDSMTNATAAYSLRRLRAGYSGSAVRLRRSSDNAEQDIGFDQEGGLDVDSLKTFINSGGAPVDTVGSAVVAFGLRKLRSAYTGYALTVRRSSDNTTQDIGFASDGNLDIESLMDFVGTGSGYVTTWYDQSGSGNNATQATASYQPTIVTSGQLNLVGNRPAIKYDGTDDRMTFTRTIGDDFTLMACYSVIAGRNPAAGNPNWYNHAGLLDADTGGLANDLGTSVDTTGQLYGGIGNPDTTLVSVSPGYNDGQMHWMALARTKSTGYFTLYNDLYTQSSASTNVNSLTATPQIWIGSLQGGGNGLNGYINEVLAYGSVLSDDNRQLLARNASSYFNINPAMVSPGTLPLDSVGGAAAAYGLRQLRGGYTGNLIRVRRSSDSALQNIGIRDGRLDVEAMLTFVGNNSGYVETWYDQSGNGRNATQGTASGQPRIVNAGVVEMQNNVPTIRFIKANGTQLSLATEVSGMTNYSVLLVARPTTAGDDTYFLTSYSVNRQLIRVQSVLSFFAGTTDPYTATIPAPHTRLTSYALVRPAAGTGTSYVNGALYPMTGTDAGTMTFGRICGLGGFYCDAYFSEIILYNSALSNANVLTLTQNMGSYFSPKAATAYVTKWYDQSGNGNDAIQPNPDLQPTLSFPPYGVNNNRPTLVFNGNQRLSATSGMPTSSDYSKVAVFSFFDTTAYNNIISSDTFGSDHAIYLENSTKLKMYHSGVFLQSSFDLLPNTQYAIAATFLQSTKTGTVYRANISGGSAVTGNSNTASSISLGAYNGGAYLKGTISEAIVFNRVLTTLDRTTLYNDQRRYFAAQ